MVALRQNTDMLGLLEPLSWRGVKLPIIARGAHFANDVVRHKVLYSAWALIELQGLVQHGAEAVSGVVYRRLPGGDG